MRILVVEDSEDLNRTLANILRENLYSVDTSFDGKEALTFFESADYDAIIMDIMMPKMDGFQLLKEIRSRGEKTPVMFLTARDGVSDRVRGLDLGADDYLIKPFSMDEFLARVRAMIRRKSGNAENVYKIADLTIDISSHSVTRADKEIELSAKEFSVLEYLIQNAGIVLSRDNILEHVWNFDYYGGSNIVDVYINYLRKKADQDYSPKLIHTVRGSGYVLKEK